MALAAAAWQPSWHVRPCTAIAWKPSWHVRPCTAIADGHIQRTTVAVKDALFCCLDESFQAVYGNATALVGGGLCRMSVPHAYISGSNVTQSMSRLERVRTGFSALSSSGVQSFDFGGAGSPSLVPRNQPTTTADVGARHRHASHTGSVARTCGAAARVGTVPQNCEKPLDGKKVPVAGTSTAVPPSYMRRRRGANIEPTSCLVQPWAAEAPTAPATTAANRARRASTRAFYFWQYRRPCSPVVGEPCASWGMEVD